MKPSSGCNLKGVFLIYNWQVFKIRGIVYIRIGDTKNVKYNYKIK
jgi:hypothetical protein